MKDVAQWLIHIEKISARFYGDAAALFEKTDLAPFLERCAQDEARHAEILDAAIKTLADHPEITPSISIDQQLKDAVEKPFVENQKRLNAKTLTRAQLIDCMVATEFSEWNDIFVYVVNTLKAIAPAYKSAAAELQHHLNHVRRFVAATEYGQQKIEKLKALEPVWHERILIIEDDLHLAELFTSVLQAEGQVDVAQDGKAGLKMIQKRFYRLIVSDVNMPGMDGIALYRQAADQFPGIGERYLFLTGNPSREIAAYFEFNHLRYLTKPTRIRDIQAHAMEILNHAPTA